MLTQTMGTVGIGLQRSVIKKKGYNRCNVVKQGGVCHWEVMPPVEEYDNVGSKEVI